MAKFKSTAKKTGSRRKAGSDAGAQAETLARTLGASAQQIWLAGVGALGKAKAEGSKLFDALVREGSSLERNARQFAGDGADAVRGAVEAKVGEARERATDTWDRLEKVFEDRVHRALVKLGVPGRDDLRELSRRVDALTTELRRQGGGRTTAARKAPARKAPAKATRKAAAAPPRTAKAAKAPARSAGRAPRKTTARG